MRGDNIAVPGEPLPPWMVELANALKLFPHERAGLPSGVIVGSAIIAKCVPLQLTTNNGPLTQFEWHLTNVERIDRPRKPAKQPQPVWFKPF